MRTIFNNAGSLGLGALTAIGKWGGWALDVIGLPDAARQLEEWKALLPDIGEGTYLLLLVSVLWFLAANFWLKAPLAPRETVYNWTMFEALEYILKHSRWGRGKSDIELEALENVRQSASDGKIQVWGRDATVFANIARNPLVEIPKEYWREYAFEEVTCLLDGAPKGCRTEASAFVGKEHVYEDVRVNRNQVMKRWPPLTLPQRVQKQVGIWTGNVTR